MKIEQAIKMAIKALLEQRHKIAFDANLADTLNADYPYAINCSKKRKKINEAIAILTELPKMIREPYQPPYSRGLK